MLVDCATSRRRCERGRDSFRWRCARNSLAASIRDGGDGATGGVLNAPSYGAGLRIAPGARVDDGWLNLSFVRRLNALEVLTLVPRLLKDGSLPDSYLKQARARRVRLQTDRPAFFTAMEEFWGPAPVEVEVLPGAMNVLARATQLRTRPERLRVRASFAIFCADAISQHFYFATLGSLFVEDLRRMSGQNSSFRWRHHPTSATCPVCLRFCRRCGLRRVVDIRESRAVALRRLLNSKRSFPESVRVMNRRSMA